MTHAELQARINDSLRGGFRRENERLEQIGGLTMIAINGQAAGFVEGLPGKW